MATTEFLSRLASQLKVNKRPAERRAVEKLLRVVEEKFLPIFNSLGGRGFNRDVKAYPNEGLQPLKPTPTAPSPTKYSRPLIGSTD